MGVLVGKKAPDFSANAVVNGSEIVKGFTLSQFKGKYVCLFFYPLDFTSVCPTEIIAFQEKLKEFKTRECEVIGVSVDSKNSHLAWLNMPQDKGGIQGVTYPLVSDFDKTISKNYDVLAGEYEIDLDENNKEVLLFTGVAQAYRGLFLIDKKGVVRHQLVNDFLLGRNIEEAIRMVDALTHLEEFGESCPANWTKGMPALK
jgi:peroxiredoxin 2/4